MDKAEEMDFMEWEKELGHDPSDFTRSVNELTDGVILPVLEAGVAVDDARESQKTGETVLRIADFTQEEGGL